MGQREAMVQAALARVGTVGGREFVAWYNEVSGRRIGLDSPWCAIFVSWCANQAGVSTAQIPIFASCTSGRTTFRRMGIWYERDARTPQRGDIVLFDWNYDPTASEHTGIVTKVDSKYIYTVEGNAGTPGAVREKKYGRKSAIVLGYAAWIEKKEEVDMTNAEVTTLITKTVDAAVDKLKKELLPKTYRKIEDVPAWGRPTVEKLVAEGRLEGDGDGNLNLTHDLLRALVIMSREANTTA